MKKYIIVLFSIFSFIIPILFVNAYDVEETPILTLNNLTFDYSTFNSANKCNELYENYELNYKTEYPYYFVLGNTFNTSCRMYIFKNKNDVDISFNIYRTNSTSHRVFYKVEPNAEIGFFNSGTTLSITSTTSFEVSNSSYTLIQLQDNFKSPLKSNVDIKLENFIVSGYSANLRYNSIKINDNNIIYNQNDVIIKNNELYNPNEIIDNEIIQVQLYSVDFELSKEVDYKNQVFRINLNRDNDIDNIYVNSFKFLGLKNNNDLYTWEDIDSYITSCSVEDYSENYTSNKYSFNILGLTQECNDLLNNTYEKIILKVNYVNAFNYYNLQTTSIVDKTFYNTFCSDCVTQNFDTNNFNYINFSTDLDVYNKRVFYSNDNIFFESFNTNTSKFDDYLIPTNYYNYNYYNVKHFQPIEIGKTIKKGFWITYYFEKETPQHFDFELIFDYKNLYYSFSISPQNTRYNNNAIYFNDIGDVVISDLEISDDVVSVYYQFDNLSDVFKAINKFMIDNNRIINEISTLTNYLFTNLNEEIRTALIVIYSTIILCVVIINLRR